MFLLGGLCAWFHVPSKRGPCPGGLLPGEGLCHGDPPDRDPRYGEERAGGTHPTGMLSCFIRKTRMAVEFRDTTVESFQNTKCNCLMTFTAF